MLKPFAGLIGLTIRSLMAYLGLIKNKKVYDVSKEDDKNIITGFIIIAFFTLSIIIYQVYFE